MIRPLLILTFGCLSAFAQQNDAAFRSALEAAEKGDFAAAIQLLSAEAAKGDPRAANAVGELYIAGRAGAPAPAEAARFFEQAAAANLPQAQLNLARMLQRGMGVERNLERAQTLTRQAAEAGFAPAQYDLGKMLEGAVDAKKPNFAEPRKWLEKAAAQGFPDAYHALVRYHDEGMGGPVSREEGTRLCRQAATAGAVAAMNDMGVRYQRGTGIAADPVAAIGWFTLATQHGSPAAAVNLGNCYEKGNGLLQDYQKAGQYYAMAAQRGFPIGELLLGKLFERGLGTDPDVVKAYALYLRAARRGLEQAEQARIALEPRLSEEEKVAADRMAEAQGEIPSPSRRASGK